MEQPVGVVVDLVLRGRGQPDEQRVEVVEDRAVLLVDRAVRLVDHDQVEVARAEPAHAAVDVVDEVHHRRVGRDVDRPSVTFSVTRLTVVAPGRCALNALAAWLTRAVRSARNSTRLTQFGLHQLIDQRDDGAGLARAGRHHQQRLALLAVERVADAPDRAHLVVAARRSPCRSRRRRAASRVVAALDQQFQLVAGVEALDLARRVAGGVVPDPVLVAVGVEDHRAAAELLPPGSRRTAWPAADPICGLLRGPLGLDDRQRQTVGAPQHVVDEALAVAGWACR